jgi:pyruvate dehydrogenase E1 component alpha subunit
MRSAIVDGNDVTKVYQAAKEAIDLARDGQGPTFLECKTYRQRGHSRSDPGKYRPDEEVKAWLEHDPLKIARRELIESGDGTEEELDCIDGEIAQTIEQAAERAKNAPWPDASEVTADVYA